MIAAHRGATPINVALRMRGLDSENWSGQNRTGRTACYGHGVCVCEGDEGGREGGRERGGRLQ